MAEMSMSPEEVSRLLRDALAKDENDLLSELGENNYLGSVPGTPAKLIASGKEWLQERVSKVRFKVCANKTVRSAAEGDLFPLAQAIWMVIAEYFGQSKALATFAALLAKQGVRDLCADVWDSNDEH